MAAVSDLGYDMLTALQNKLEALFVYDTYLEHCPQPGTTPTCGCSRRSAGRTSGTRNACAMSWSG